MERSIGRVNVVGPRQDKCCYRLQRGINRSYGSVKAERVLIAARLLERKRLEFEALEREIAEFEKRVKVSDNGNYRASRVVNCLIQ